MSSPLGKHHQNIYDAIFQHPIAHNLDRRDVIAMLSALAEVSEEPNGNVHISRNGQSLVLHASKNNNIADADEVMAIRHFLDRSAPAAPTSAAPGHFLVVIDHRQARIYQTELHGAIPQRITPYDPHGYGRNLHYVQDDSSGQRKPERRSFYESIVKTLRGATGILIFGSATGASSAMEQLLSELREHHHALAQCVVGSIALDAQHLTEDQILAQAREFYAHRPPVSTANA